jgi:hypothetical protein
MAGLVFLWRHGAYHVLMCAHNCCLRTIMWQRISTFCLGLALVIAMSGCFGSEKDSGKYKDQDKPKPVKEK